MKTQVGEGELEVTLCAVWTASTVDFGDITNERIVPIFIVALGGAESAL